jgi:CheY-like chemotaxis protein
VRCPEAAVTFSPIIRDQDEQTEPVLLYVEDDDTAAFLFRTALDELQPPLRLFITQNSRSAWAFLHRDQPFPEAPTPHLVVLDLHLPGENGLELLQSMRENIPNWTFRVIFFSTSLDDEHRAQAKALGAVEFIHKPDTYPEFQQAIRHIHTLACA